MVANLSDSMMQVIREQMLRNGEQLCAVIDGAQDLELAYIAKQIYGESIVPLFQGEMAGALADVAPYFTHIDLQNDYLSHWQEKLGNNVGVLFATTNNDDNQLVQHLREIFVVTDETEQEFFFRFYDPRVLRSFLPSCSESELRRFFGPITSFMVESEQPNQLTVYSIAEDSLSISEFEFSIDAS